LDFKLFNMMQVSANRSRQAEALWRCFEAALKGQEILAQG
jgi:hypothetical protein